MGSACLSNLDWAGMGRLVLCGAAHGHSSWNDRECLPCMSTATEVAANYFFRARLSQRLCVGYRAAVVVNVLSGSPTRHYTLFTLFTHNAGPEDFCCLQPWRQRALERPHRPQGRFLAHRQSEGAFCLSVRRCVGEASIWKLEDGRCAAGERRPATGPLVRAGLDFRRSCLRACSPAPALLGHRPVWGVGEAIFHV